MRVLATTFVVLLLGAALWIALDAGSGAPAADAASLNRPARGGGPAVAADGALVEPAGRTRRAGDRVSDLRTELDADRSGPDQPDAEAVLETATVQIVDADTDDPVPGAEVLYLRTHPNPESMNAAERRALDRTRIDPERYLRGFGERAVADGEGRAEVRFRPPWTQVAARHGERFGTSWINTDQTVPRGGWRVEVALDRTLSVLVVDRRGDPVHDVPVAVRFRHLPSWSQRVRDHAQTIGFTDRDGLVVAPHVQTWSVHEEAGARRARVSVAIVGRRGGGATVDVDRLPVERVRLVCPDTGSVVVRAVDVQDRAVDRFTARLQPVENGEVVGGDAGPTNHVQADGGRATFEHVILGATFRVDAWIGNQRAGTTFTGPVRPGQQVEVRVRPDPGTRELTARAVDADGAPLSERDVQIRVRARRGGAWSHQRTGGDGAFGVLLTGKTEGLRTLDVELLDERHRSTGIRGSVALPEQLVRATTDLGSVVLVEAPLVLDGRIVDPTDPTPTGVMLFVEQLTARAGGDRAARWRWVDGLSVRNEPDGSFEMRGTTTGGRLRLRLVSSRHLPVPPIDFTPGTTGLEVAVEVGGVVRATVLHDAAVRAPELRLKLEPHDPAALAEPVEASIHPFPGAGRRTAGVVERSEPGRTTFRFEGLLPATYDLAVHAGPAIRPAATVPEVEVRAGASTDDPRLDGIDLRGRLRRIEVRVVDPSGNPVGDRRAVVLVQDRDPGVDLAGQRLRDGATVLWTSEPSLDLLVAAPGHPVEERFGVHDDVVVTLRPGHRVRLRVVGHDVELPDGVDLRVSVAADPRRERDRRRYRLGRAGGALADLIGQRTVRVEPDARGEFLLSVREPGTYGLSVRLSRKAEGDTRRVDGVAPASFDVADTEAEQTVGVVIPPERVRAALDGWQRRG